MEIEPVRSNAIDPAVPVPSALPIALSAKSAAAAERLDDDADGVVATGQDVAGLRIADVASIAATDALQQHAVGPVAGGLDRAGEVESDRPGGAGAGFAGEGAVGITARTANRLGDDADCVVALGQDVAGLRDSHVAGWWCRWSAAPCRASPRPRSEPNR